MPAHQLWLKVPRNVVFERGFGIQHKPGDVKDDLSGAAHSIDPLTGFACPKVTWSAEDPLNWSLSGDPVADYVYGTVPTTTKRWPIHTAEGEFTATSATELAAGHGFFFSFLIWQAPSTGSGQAREIRVKFGGGFTLKLSDGVAELLRGDGEAAETIGFQSFWPQEEWFGRFHTLYVYNIGTAVAVRRLGDAVRETGILAFDEAAGDRSPKFALQAAKVSIESTGHVAVFLAPERHDTTLSFQHAAIRMPETSTQEPEASFRWIAPNVTGEEEPPAEPTITVLDGDGSSLGDAPYEDFRYQVDATLTSDTSPNLYVTSTRVWFPPLTGSDGAAAQDLAAIDGIAVQRVTEKLSLADQDGRLDFDLIALRGSVSPYVQANMLGAWKPRGVLRAAFLTDRPTLGFPSRTLERLSFSARTRWKAFATQKWTGSETYGGKLLAEAYRDVALRAGLDASEAVIYAGGYRLPEPDDDGDEGLEFRNEQSIADILTYLRDQFGAGDVLRFRPDGLFYAEPLPTAHSGVTFHWSTPQTELADILAGTSDYPRVLRASWEEALSEEGFANEVFVLGYDKAKRPLLSFATDWDSINRPTLDLIGTINPNYVGEFRRLVIIDPALMRQEVVNWVCRQVFERVRKLRIFAKFEAMYVDTLLPGALVTIDGRGTWRLLSMETEWVKDAPAGLSSYEAEAVL